MNPLRGSSGGWPMSISMSSSRRPTLQETADALLEEMMAMVPKGAPTFDASPLSVRARRRHRTVSS
jgi:hypothetical protein